MQEVWKDIPDYEGLYQVSDLGRVKSLEKTRVIGSGGFRVHHERILKPGKDSCGYLVVVLCNYGSQKTFKVHRLVYEAFNGKTKLGIDHIIEGNKFDNRLCNLQAITHRENVTKHKKTLNNTSKYTGVSFEKRRNKWISNIQINGKRNYLGSFTNEIDAAKAYKNALSLIP